MMRLACALALAAASAVALANEKSTAPAATGNAAAAATAPNAPSAPRAKGDTSRPAATEVRNWAEIDTNRDHLISAEEMERWLAAQHAKRK